MSLYTPALDSAFNNLIQRIQNLTECLSSASAALPQSQKPRPGGKDASKVIATSPYFALETTRKRARSPSPVPRKKKKSRKKADACRVDIPVVTSPYFAPTPTKEELPSTPARGRKRDKLQKTVTSPYFSGNSQGANDLVSRPRKRAKTIVDVPVLPVIDPPARWWKKEPLPVKDSRSFARFRAHSSLYYQLWLAKPRLIQERVADDSWKLLIAVMLLNKTAGKAAIPIFWQIIDRWSTPLLLSQADETELTAVLRSLGLQRLRCNRLIKLSKSYLDDPPNPNNLRRSTCKVFGERYKPTPVSHLPGAGAYALDSYRIFYLGDGNDPEEWKSVMPGDKELIRYLRWKWAFEERKKWGPDSGVTGDVDVEYLERLPCLLQN